MSTAPPFPQILTVLCDRAPALEEVLGVLSRIGAQARPEPRGTGWTLGHPGVLVPGGPDLPGVFVDILPLPWPDGLGARDEDEALRTAALQGAFGPTPAPGALARASTHAAHWPEAAAAVATHTTVLRIRTSPHFPGTAASPAATWRHLTGIGLLLLSLPGATAWFAPQGEVLHSRSTLVPALQRAQDAGHQPVDVWTGLRFFRLGDADGWAVMDTVGMSILDGTDGEFCFRPEELDPREAGAFLRNVTLYLLDGSKPVDEGHTLEGPEMRVRVVRPERCLVAPSRPVLRLVPVAGRPLPAVLGGPGA